MSDETLPAFRDYLARDEGPALLEGALLIAEAFQPHVDRAACHAALDELARELAPGLPPGDAGDAAGTARALAAYLHDVAGFSGNAVDYYDARNSFIDQVLRRRTGIPISLALVYMEAGRRCGLPLHGVGFPGHFLVRLEAHPPVLVDPFAGAVLDEEGLQVLLRQALGAAARLEPGHLQPAAPREMLFRMLTNLKHIYLRQSDLPHALACSHRLLALAPGAVPEYRDRGLIQRELGLAAEALADLQHYLAHAPRDVHVETLERTVRELEGQLRRFN
ncbi:MAG: tetratricopeptide repeat protein [Candidatus Lambdaproteobacteria bacterium]|nr:tetratricopeptide repeat protein [Candidatus Lambdaproteobacteria bacterium]